jgi:hypothetical protein
MFHGTRNVFRPFKHFKGLLIMINFQCAMTVPNGLQPHLFLRLFECLETHKNPERILERI